VIFSWLQTGGGGVHLNPEAISEAIAVARAFCIKQAPENLETPTETSPRDI